MNDDSESPFNNTPEPEDEEQSTSPKKHRHHVYVPQTELEKARHDLHCQVDIDNYKVQQDQLELRRQRDELKLKQEIANSEWTLETIPDEKIKNELQTKNNLMILKKQIEVSPEMIDLQQKRDLIKLNTEVEEAEQTRKKRKLQHKVDMMKLEHEKDFLQTNEQKRLLSNRLDVLKLQLEVYEKEEQIRDWVETVPERLIDPVKVMEDGTKELIISDRVIEMPMRISPHTAERITQQIHYYNNQSRDLPVFLLIDYCVGGSCMAGSNILKTMLDSTAPVYVVVKSWAASMAAVIATRAKYCYVYKDAYIMHHQSSAHICGNLSDLSDQLNQLKKSSVRCEQPLVDRINERTGGDLTVEGFTKGMYEFAKDGDWLLFGDEAVEHGWADEVVGRIVETGITRHPEALFRDILRSKLQHGWRWNETESERLPLGYNNNIHELEKVEAERNLPKLRPGDCYWLYNPNNFFRYSG